MFKFKRLMAILLFFHLGSLIGYESRAESLETVGKSSQAVNDNNTVATATVEDKMAFSESVLPFEIVEQKRVKKGGSLDPLLAPKYILLDVKAVLDEASSKLSEPKVTATLRALLNEVLGEQRQRGEEIDGVSAFLYQSRDHIIGGSSALGRAEWWPKGHSFSPDNVVNIKNKATYVQTVDVFYLPKAVPTIVERLSENQRRMIFTDLVRAEDRAMHQAETQYPTDAFKIPNSKLKTYDFKTAMQKKMEVERRLRITYERELLQRHGLTEKELNDIKKEAMNAKWPLPPQKVYE